MIKKLSAVALSVTVYLSLAVPSFAQTTVVNPCPTAAGAGFQRLCLITGPTLAAFIPDLITFLFVLAVIITTFFLIYGGIKWVTSGGDKAQLETARNIIIAAIIGLVITFATYLILNIILNVFGLNNVTNYQIPQLNLSSP